MKRTRYHVLLLALVLAALLAASRARAGDPDFDIVSKTTLTLDDRGDKWLVFSQSQEKRTFLSKRSTYITSVTVGEQYYSQIGRIAAYYQGDAVRGSNYSVENADDEDVFISDYKTHKITFSHNIQVGATADLNYERVYTSAMFMPVLMVPNIDRVKEYTLVVEHPREVNVAFEVFFPNGTLPYSVDSSDAKKSIITFTNVRSETELVNYPFNGFRAAIKVHARKDGHDITPGSPTQFSQWYLGLFDQSPQLPAEYSTLLRAQLDKAAGPLEKLRTIHDYVRNTIRYIAEEDNINAFVPRPPALVLKHGYGDCKDRAYLVRTLAKREGIDVKMVLVATDPQPPFGSVDISRFNHVICLYEGPAGRVYFDPTARYSPFGTLPSREIGSEGLLLDPVHAERVTIEAPEVVPSIDISISAKLDELKKAKATVRLRASALAVGNAAAEMRRPLDRENYLSNYITQYFSKISFDYFKVESRTDSLITLTCDADLSEFLIMSDAHTYLPRMPFRVVTTELLDRTGDSLPVYAPAAARLAMTVDLEHPGYDADTSTVAFGAGKELGFSTSLTGNGRDASRLRFEVSHIRRIIPVAEKQQYFDFCRSMFGQKKNVYVLTRRGS